jgi:hypothetical protein
MIMIVSLTRIYIKGLIFAYEILSHLDPSSEEVKNRLLVLEIIKSYSRKSKRSSEEILFEKKSMMHYCNQKGC